MSSENINIQAEIDSAKSTGEILLAYAKAAVVADMFKSGAVVEHVAHVPDFRGVKSRQIQDLKLGISVEHIGHITDV